MKPPIHKTYQQYVNGLGPTGADIEGPFYKPIAPFRRQLLDSSQVNLTLIGKVLDTDGNAIPHALLDFWQADVQGNYDNVGYQLRGRQYADKDGNYWLKTIHPGFYKMDVNEYRCSHIHVKVWAEGYQMLTTQLYFSDDPYDASDHWFNKNRVICSTKDSTATFNFVLEKL